MNVLGLWDGHDAAACLVSDGRIVAAMGEERLTRRKFQRGFPELALEAVLREGGIGPEEIDLVALGGTAGRAPMRLADALFARRVRGPGPMTLANRLYRHYENLTAGAAGWKTLEPAVGCWPIRQRLRSAGLSADVPLRLVRHHAAHAFSAASLLPNGTGLVWTMDGYGDGLWAAATRWERGRPAVLARVPYRDSPAVTYGSVTQLLGFGEGEEGKLTALAAHRPAAILADYFASGPVARGGPLLPSEVRFLRRFAPEDVAAGLQAAVESRVLDVMSAHPPRPGEALALAGGLFANVTLNARLVATWPDSEVAVFPAMGDGGIAAGAALFAWHERQGTLPTFPGPYLGTSPDLRFSELQVPSSLRVVSTRRPERRVAEILARKGVVAVLDGRDEFGPRALGNRTLLFAATDQSLADRVQERLGRNAIMPFAPICRNRNVDALFEPPYPASERSDYGLLFMTFAIKARPGTTQRYPVAVHVDGTSRVQSLGGRQQRMVYRILSEYEKLTGEQLLINTSFNRHGEPIVSSVEDACRAFEATGFDAMLLGRTLVVPREEMS